MGFAFPGGGGGGPRTIRDVYGTQDVGSILRARPCAAIPPFSSIPGAPMMICETPFIRRTHEAGPENVCPDRPGGGPGVSRMAERAERPAASEARPAWKALGRHYRETHGSHRGVHDVREGWECGGCCLCDVGCHCHHVGRLELGWGNPGSDLQSKHQGRGRDQRAGCSTHRRNGCVLPGEGSSIPSGGRSLVSRNPGNAGRPHDHVGRIRDHEPRRGPCPGNGDGRGVPHGSRCCSTHSVQRASHRAVAVFQGGLSYPPRGSGESGAQGRGDLQAERPSEHAREAGPGNSRPGCRVR
jgi:hypothetical protein